MLPSAFQDPIVLAITAAAGLLLLLLIFKREGSSKTSVKPVAKSPRVQKGYTRAEVAQHAREGDCWLIIRPRNSEKDMVYDISEYAGYHPGGDAIYNNAGGDSTVGFSGPQHPPTVQDVISEYCIGWVEDE